MKAVSNINGNQKTTSYADNFYYRNSPSSSYTKLNRAFFRDISTNANTPFVQFYQYDNTPPAITITSSTTDTINQQYTLTGTIKDLHSGLASATVNGINLSVVSDNFSKDFILSGDTGKSGVNYFTINATDNAGNSSSVTVSVNYVNQKNDTSYNWTDTYTTEEIAKNNKNETSTCHDYWVRVGDVGYKYRDEGTAISNRAGSDEYSFQPSTANINSTIPLPKGLSNISGLISANTENGTGYGSSYSCSISLYDQTSGYTIASTSFTGKVEWKGGDNADGHHESSGTSNASFNWNITQEQSKHNLVLIISGSASGAQFRASTSKVGLSAVPTFTFY